MLNNNKISVKFAIDILALSCRSDKEMDPRLLHKTDWHESYRRNEV